VINRRACRVLVSVVLAVCAVASTAGGARADGAPTPRVIVSTGDSITRAFNVDWCCFLSDSPSRSWSTGGNAAVNSHYQRLLRFAPHVEAAHNVARSGARMGELAGQLRTAAGLGADYVTVLMGANDACTSSVASMTPAESFEAQFRAAMADFTSRRPQAQVFVASIPDVYHLWELFHDNAWATFVWDTFDICQSMLSTANTEATRQDVVARIDAFNAALGGVCAEFRRCRWDGGAVSAVQFAAGDVSSIDFFHPSVQGQRRLADVTWAAGYWPTRG
jgi:lysophospholipase L1-like esterase